MIYDELKKKYGSKGVKLIKYGEKVRSSCIVIGIIAFIIGLLYALSMIRLSFWLFLMIFFVSAILASLIYGFGNFTIYVLSALGELVINTEMMARVECEGVNFTDIKGDKQEVPDENEKNDETLLSDTLYEQTDW